MLLVVLQAEKVHELNEEIGKLLAKAEQLGAEGNVDEAQKVLQEVEKVRTRKKDAEVRRGSRELLILLLSYLAFFYIVLFEMSFTVLVFPPSEPPTPSFVSPLRKSTETPCLPPASSSRSCVCVKCALLTWVSMIMTVDWLTTLVGNFTWASSRSERNWIS